MSQPVISVAQMREWEQASWAAGRNEADVIRRVGETVARRALQLTRSGDVILLLAGKGHNGDDVRAAQNPLAGRRVMLLDVSDPENQLAALEQALAARPALIVDGLFGIGLDRPLDPAWCQFIRRVNEARVPVLAVDVPSGLNADTGEPQPESVRAAITLSVGAAKTGLLLRPAWPFVGRLEVAADIGLVPCPLKGGWNWILPDDFAGFPPPRDTATHKGTHGHLAILAGSLGYHGAAVLATRGAQRAQPGLVTVFPQPDVYHPIAAQLQSAMVLPWRPELKYTGGFSALLCGPGLAMPSPPEEIKNNLRHLWLGSTMPVIVDASALDWIPIGMVSDKNIRVMTPHPGEAARLMGTKPELIQADRPRAVRELSKRYGNCWVVLKGYQTFIGRSTGEMFVNSTGNPQLAQGGSGDLLAGYLAGLLAQPALQADPLTTVCYAVWQHGLAADQLTSQRKNWIIEDLAEVIGDATVQNS